MIEDVVDLYRAVAEEDGVELALEPPSDIRLRGDGQLLAQAIGNLIDNAIKYARDGKVVVVSVAREGEQAAVTVADRGPGIPNIELALKDGFTTGNGLGLGLSGARRLCNEFSIESKPGEGTRVTITRWR